MTWLPIIQRELRVRARRRSGHWTRFGIALGALLLCLPQLMTPASSSFLVVGGRGQAMFSGLVAAAFLISCSACLLTAEALTAERKEGTLGLLFLTRVKALDVLLGKFGSVGLTCLCGLLAFVPVMVVPILAGGVTGGEACRKGLALLATLCLALTVGLWAGTASRASGIRTRAVKTALVLIVVPFCLSPLPPLKLLGMLSPLSAVVAAGDLAYRSAPAKYWFSLAGSGLLTALLLLVSALRLRLLRQESEPEAEPPKRIPFTLFGRPVSPGRWPSGQAGTSPVAWLVRRQPGMKARFWLAALLVLVYRLSFLGLTRASGLLGMRSLFTFSGVFWLAVSALENALIAWAASQFFVQARHNAELEVLLTTPLGGKALVSEQWSTLLRLLRAPLLVMLIPALLNLLMMLYGMPRASAIWMPAEYRLQSCISLALNVAETLLHVFALCWLALWFGLKARTQAGAVLWSVGLAVGAPYLFTMLFYGGFGSLFFSLLSTARWRFQTLSWGLQCLILLFECGLIWWARGRLRSELTGAAPGRFSSWESVVLAVRRARHWTPA